MKKYLTPLQEQSGVSDDKTFVDEAGAFLASPGIEGEESTPYIDTKGIPTVGIGINLHKFADAYLAELGISPGDEATALTNVLNKTYATKKDLDDALDKAMAPYVPKGKTVDDILQLSNAKIEDLYQKVAMGDPTTGLNPNRKPSIYTNYKNFLRKNRISNEVAPGESPLNPSIPGSLMTTSREGIAIFSLYYNNPGTLLPSTSHIVSDLRRQSDGSFTNRADAWFQIRYGSNGGALVTTDPTSGFDGTATRRDEESTIFGLYNAGDVASDGTVTAPLNEALAAYGNLSRNTNVTSGRSSTAQQVISKYNGVLTNRQYAFDYESLYGTFVSNANTNLKGVVALSSGGSVQQLTSLNVKSLEDVLQPAADALIKRYVTDITYNPWVSSNFAADTISSLDVQVALKKGGSDLMASQRKGYQLDTGSDQDDKDSVLIAQGGKDTLDGSGSGNDALIGGTGNDTIIGGTGNDYVVAGTGNDSIVLTGSGNDTVVLGTSNNPQIAGRDTVDATNDSGQVTYYVGKGTQETLKLGTGTTTLFVDDAGTLTPLNITAKYLSPGQWLDTQDDALVVQRADNTMEVIYGGADSTVGSQASTDSRLSLDALEADAADTVGTSTASGALELTLENFTGTSDAGITLTPSNATQPAAENLEQLAAEGDLTTLNAPDSANYDPQDASVFYDVGEGSQSAPSLYGFSTPVAGGVRINGMGLASDIYAGNGPVGVYAYEYSYRAATSPEIDNITIQGGAGNQTLVGTGSGNETILGGAVGQNTADTTLIDGGGANGLLVGGSQGSVIYGGTGQDTLVASSKAPNSSYNPFSWVIAGLSFVGNSTPRYAGVPYNPSGIAEGVSGNGSSFWVKETVYQRDTPHAAGTQSSPFNFFGSSLDPSVVDPSSTLPGSLLMGGSGIDYLFGNTGNDTIVGGTPINVAAGTTAEFLVGGAGADLIYGGPQEWIYTDLPPGDGVDWANMDPTDADTVEAGAGNETIYGSGGNDVIIGGTGNDLINPGNGNARITTGSGNATVQGGSGNETIIADGASDSIQSGNGNTDIQLKNGQSWVTLGTGSDTVDIDGGTASITGASGNATITAGLGVGQDTITPGTGSVTFDLVNGLTESNLVVRGGVNGDLVLSGEGGATQLTVSGYFNAGDDVSIEFEDGVTLTRSQLIQMEMAGTTGNDMIYGTSAANLIDGKGGNDVEYGKGGNDSFVFDSGYGQLTINESYASGNTSIVKLGVGIVASALKVTTDGTNLYLTDGVAGDKITLTNMVGSDASGVSGVQLSDGTALSRSQLLQMAMTGTASNDSLVGNADANLIDGKGGNDTVEGKGGSDTFVFDAGYGQLDIRESYASGQTPILQLGVGITADDLKVEDAGPTGDDLMLTDGVSGDQVILAGMWTSSSKGVAVVKLADGTSLTRAQLIQMEMAGTPGDDTIYGTSGADLIDGKGGNDSVIGDGGNDTFVFNSGYGKLAIDELQSIVGSSPNRAVLRLGSDISPTAVHVIEDDMHDFVITDGIAGDRITLQSPIERGYPSATAWGANIQFQGGSTLNVSQLRQMVTNLDGTIGSDYLVGATGADTIDGKGGNDYEIGDGGDDTFVYNKGYGALEIDGDYGYTLQLGSEFTASNLNVSIGHSHYGDDLILTDGTLGRDGDVIRLDGAEWDGPTGTIKFSDGTTVSTSQLSSGKTLSYYSGVETYRLGAYSTNQLIWDANTAGPIDVFYEDGITSADVAVRGNANDYLTLINRSTGSQFEGQFDVDGNIDLSVTFSNGVTWGESQIIHAMETGTAGSDTLSGTSNNERFDGKGGNDTVAGNGGSDTFVFNPGYGALEINEKYTSGQQPVLQLGVGITASALQVTAAGINLVLTDGVSGDQIALDGQNSSDNEGVTLVQFADGETLTAAQLIQMSQEIGGTKGNDTLTGTTGADWIDGKGGNDLVVGNGGSDTFVFNAGYGDLEINEAYTSGQQPILRLGAGIASSALDVTASGANLVLTDGISGDRVTLDNENASGGGVALVHFADGTTLTAARLIQLSQEIHGTTGNDTLMGTSGADLIDGKGGSDSVIGNGGSDTFVFNAGYGDLEISEAYTSGQQPVLQLGTGITASALQVVVVGPNLILTDGVSGDQITLDNQYSSDDEGVALVRFADGTTWNSAQLIQMSHDFIGTAGNDLLVGNSGSDLIDGKGGNDSVVGKGGDDTFVFNAGYGHLDINESFSSGQAPVLQLGAGITASNLTVTQNVSGSGLVLADGVSGDQVTLENAIFNDSVYGVQEVQFADGTTLTEAQLIQQETSIPGNGASITGGSGEDTLVADTANESLVGGSGHEVFDFKSGFGQDTLLVDDAAASNTILFGAGISVSDLTFSTDGSELLITDKNSNGADGQASSIKLPDHFVNGQPVSDVGELDFNDGTTLTMTQIDQLFASSPSPAPSPSPSPAPSPAPAPAPAPGTTVLTAGPSNTLTSDNGTDLLKANSGNDTLTGGSGTDTLESGMGNTLMNGGSGTESYLFDTGFGQDTVVADDGAESNTIVFGSGITVSDLTFSTDGSELLIIDTNSNGADDQASSIKLPDHFVDGQPANDVGELDFSNGTSVTMAQINQLFAPAPAPAPAPSTVLTAGPSNTLTSDNGTDLLKANSGNDTLTGGSGTDTLESGVGNTLMNGGSGTESYLFDTGFGQNTVVADDAATSNTILFGSGITASDLTFSTDGSELLITDTNSNGADGQASSIKLPDHFVNGQPVNDVGELDFSNGTSVTMSQINQLFASSPAPALAPAAAEAPALAPEAQAMSMSSLTNVAQWRDAVVAFEDGALNSSMLGTAGSSMARLGQLTVAQPEFLPHLSLLTHAIASYTAGSTAAAVTAPVTHADTGKLMLHAAG